MKTRKTFEVETLRNKVNAYLASDDPKITNETRLAVASLLSQVLLDTGNYNGFNYLKWMSPEGFTQWDKDGRPEDKAKYIGNETKRFYYGKMLT